MVLLISDYIWFGWFIVMHERNGHAACVVTSWDMAGTWLVRSRRARRRTRRALLANGYMLVAGKDTRWVYAIADTMIASVARWIGADAVQNRRILRRGANIR